MKCQVNLKKMLKISLNIVYILVICFCFVGIYSNNFIHSNVQLKLLKGELSIPISECTTLQKSTIMKFGEVKESLPVMEIRYFKMEKS